ncbi:hypothetical protein LCGC14_0360210 [marine sediment metagenome]|uniref:VRR-NUC domain-containing protein n=1 Tax=marine sediment metagenome TaxID=412755 RepID=A0A0F9TR94_9ZZZZ
MKKRSRKKIYEDYSDAIKAMRDGQPVKRQGAKDGSIPTQPIVPVPNLLESVVLKQCLVWLKAHGIFASRHDSGSFQNDRGQWGTYGIKNAGDIVGLFATGQHFEIEVKRGSGGRLSEGQQKRMQDIRNRNGMYLVIHGIPELEHYLGHMLL